MVIYAVSTNSSIGQLFIAGIIPGILLALTLMTVTWLVAKNATTPASHGHQLLKFFAPSVKVSGDCS